MSEELTASMRETPAAVGSRTSPHTTSRAQLRNFKNAPATTVRTYPQIASSSTVNYLASRNTIIEGFPTGV
jgi:hypothetical protein